ncbi:MAG: nuclear transport factor 2 family protein [Rhodothermales bacterium]
MTAISIDAKTDEAEIRTTIKQFSTAADRQDAARIGEVLHAEAQQFYKGADGLVRLETKIYLNLIEQKKIGGEARELHIKNVDVNGDMASVNAVMSGKDYTFDNYISLMKVDGSWQIMSIILRMAKK